ncbi:MAG TPA: cytochrome P450 [Dehalococcoidia bacterium]|nr:cytochrome P450 [Dehalococcoidia bacterium]
MTAEPETRETPVPTGVARTPLAPAFQADPYPILDDLREREPVHHDTVLQRWILTRHDDVDRVLRDRTLSVDPRNAGENTFERMFLGAEGLTEDGHMSMLFSDPPYHTRLRGLVSKAFSARAVEAMAPRIQQVVDDLLDAVAGRESFDLIEDFAGPLPTIVIAEMLGVDPADRADFKRWSDIGVMVFNPLLTPVERALIEKAGTALHDYFSRAIAERRARPRADLISSLIAVEEGGERLSDDEILTMCGLLLTAGNVTTTDLIGNGVYALLRFPDQLRKLQADPSLIKSAVEEMLRFDSPVTQSGRTPLAPVEFGGCPIAAGQSITPSLSAANHDPAAYPDPHTFDITRADTHHHSFGGGVHFCLGAPLARLEAQIGIATLVRRFPTLRLSEEPVEWRKIPSFRGLATFTVRV